MKRHQRLLHNRPAAVKFIPQARQICARKWPSSPVNLPNGSMPEHLDSIVLRDGYSVDVTMLRDPSPQVDLSQDIVLHVRSHWKRVTGFNPLQAQGYQEIEVTRLPRQAFIQDDLHFRWRILTQEDFQFEGSTMQRQDIAEMIMAQGPLSGTKLNVDGMVIGHGMLAMSLCLSEIVLTEIYSDGRSGGVKPLYRDITQSVAPKKCLVVFPYHRSAHYGGNSPTHSRDMQPNNTGSPLSTPDTRRIHNTPPHKIV